MPRLVVPILFLPFFDLALLVEHAVIREARGARNREISRLFGVTLIFCAAQAVDLLRHGRSGSITTPLPITHILPRPQDAARG